jgi:endonuclease-8
MPEGDTLFRTAYTLRLALKDREITDFRSPLPELQNADLIGHQIIDVEARGKNLLIHFDDGRALYSHLRMDGSWHIYKPEVPWQKPERLAKAVIATREYIAVCFNAPVVELLTATAMKRHPVLSKLGPDLLKENFDWEEVLRRLRAHDAIPIGEALMRQHILAGIGNVYKAEVLFLCKADPFACVDQYSDRQLKNIVYKAHELLKQNIHGKLRKTRNSLDKQRYWVYERSGRPCRKCGEKIRMRRQGFDGRSTYWCPKCQHTSE